MSDPGEHDEPRRRERRARPRSASGPLRAWGALTSAQQRTAVAAIVVLISLQAPWYTETLTPVGTRRATITENTISALGAFSFVEAAVLLVGGAVLALTWGRATDRRFSLPFPDGTLVVAAAGWVGLLVVYRLFDRPDTEIVGQVSRSVGLSWGIFASLAAVGLLLACGLDQRRAGAPRRGPVPEPRGPRVDPATVVVGREERRRSRPATPEPETRVARRREVAEERPAPDAETRVTRRRERTTMPEPETRVARSRGEERPAAGTGERPARSDDGGWEVPDAVVERPRPRPPAPDEERTRALGRSEATRLLRESGIDTDDPRPARPRRSSREDEPPRDERR
jgi:hypothetical protein